MADALLCQDFVHGYQDACFLHVAELIVDGSAEHPHRRAEAHVGIDQGRDVVAQLADFPVQNLVVILEVIFAEEGLQFLLVGLYGQRVDGSHQPVLVGKMFPQEVQNHVAPLADVIGIHGHLPEEIFHVGHDDRQRAKSVPQVVEGKQSLAVGTCRLVLHGDKRASQLYGGRHILFQELFREVEHVRRGKHGRPFLVVAHVSAQDVPVAAQDFLRLGIPHNQLLARVGHQVKLVDVHRLARSPACGAESNLAQASYLPHRVGGIVRRDDVYLVVAAVGHAQAPVLSQFRLQGLFAYRCYDIFHTCMYL